MRLYDCRVDGVSLAALVISAGRSRPEDRHGGGRLSQEMSCFRRICTRPSMALSRCQRNRVARATGLLCCTSWRHQDRAIDDRVQMHLKRDIPWLSPSPSCRSHRCLRHIILVWSMLITGSQSASWRMAGFLLSQSPCNNQLTSAPRNAEATRESITSWRRKMTESIRVGLFLGMLKVSLNVYASSGASMHSVCR